MENYEELLQQVSSLRHLESVVSDIKDGIADLQTSFDKSKEVVYGPYQEISLKTKALEKAQDVSDKLRHICRFLTLVGRLESLSVQVTLEETTKDRSDLAMDWIKAALVIHELDGIMAHCDLSAIHVIQNVMPFVAESKEKILSTGKALLTRGLLNNVITCDELYDTRKLTLTKKDLSDMATSLQIFSHLDILVDTVKDTLTATVKECGAQTRSLLDGAAISKKVKETPAPGPKSSVRRVNEPQGSDTSSKAWNLVLWKNLEELTDALYKNCIQVRALVIA